MAPTPCDYPPPRSAFKGDGRTTCALCAEPLDGDEPERLVRGCYVRVHEDCLEDGDE